MSFDALLSFKHLLHLLWELRRVELFNLHISQSDVPLVNEIAAQVNFPVSLRRRVDRVHFLTALLIRAGSWSLSLLLFVYDQLLLGAAFLFPLRIITLLIKLILCLVLILLNEIVPVAS